LLRKNYELFAQLKCGHALIWLPVFLLTAITRSSSYAKEKALNLQSLPVRNGLKIESHVLGSVLYAFAYSFLLILAPFLLTIITMGQSQNLEAIGILGGVPASLRGK